MFGRLRAGQPRTVPNRAGPVKAVTVVIATRNRRPELCATLGRLRALPEEPPVIVVDNGSADGTPAAVRDAFPEVEVVARRRNAGASAATSECAGPAPGTWR